jgi:diguanylate cyclase (GGDEF)-like protein/PAS domain S-box-containing protein
MHAMTDVAACSGSTVPVDGAARAYGERVRHLYRLSRSGYPGTLITASIITFALWGVVDNVLLAGWFSLVIAITSGRYLLYRAYVLTPSADAVARSWADRFLAGATAMGCMWGILATVLFPVASVPHQFLVIFIIGGMTMSAAVALAPVRRVFYGFVFPALVPLSANLLLQNDALQILMGALAVVFTVVILAFAVEMKESVLAAIGIKFENADLVTRLSAASRQIEQANAQLQEKLRSQEDIREALRQASQKLEALIKAAPLAIILRDAEGRIEKWNAAAERMFGWTESEVLGKMVPWYPPGKEDEGERYRNMILRGEVFSDVEAVRLRKDGAPLTVSLSGAPVHDERGNAIGVMIIVADITGRKRVEQRLRMEHAITRVLAESRSVDEAAPAVLRTIGEAAGWVYGGRWELDRTRNLLRCAETWCVAVPEIEQFRAFNHLRTQLPDRKHGLIHRVWKSNLPEWTRDIAQETGMRRAAAALKAGLHAGFAFPILIGEEFYGVMEFFGREVREPDPDLMGLVHTVGSQVGQFIARKQAEDDLQFVATHDALTGLPNRTMFSDRLTQALAQAQRYNRRLAVLFVDLDGFKTVNDTFGHAAGDVLLRELAARLGSCLREGDVIGRIGGDEFVVLIEEFDDPARLELVARKMLDTVARPVPVRGRECRVTGSVGISTYPRDGKDSQALLRNADSAMYRAKEQGKNRFQFYSG